MTWRIKNKTNKKEMIILLIRKNMKNQNFRGRNLNESQQLLKNWKLTETWNHRVTNYQTLGWRKISFWFFLSCALQFYHKWLLFHYCHNLINQFTSLSCLIMFLRLRSACLIYFFSIYLQYLVRNRKWMVFNAMMKTKSFHWVFCQFFKRINIWFWHLWV